MNDINQKTQNIVVPILTREKLFVAVFTWR